MKKKKVNKILPIVFAFVFVLGMLLCSAYTSPLYQSYYGADSALFTLIGKGITEGKTVYKDLFDHKGPILFFIEAWGYFIGKSAGIFALQCVFGLVNLLFLYKAWIEIKRHQNNNSVLELIVVFLAGCAVFFYTFQNGNLSEEYSLPLISMCILLFVKYAHNVEDNAKHPYLYSFIYGVAIMLLVLIRLNNAITVLAGVFAIVIYLIFKKEYKNLFLNILFGFLGLCAVALPVVIYFISKSALQDMIYATFIYNFKYAGNISHQSIIANLPKFIVLYFPILCSLYLISVKLKKEKKIVFFDFLVITVVVLNAIILIVSNIYPHYFTIYIPVFVLTLFAYFTLDCKILKNILIILCIGMHLFQAGIVSAKNIYANYVIGHYQEKHSYIAEKVKQIPENERDSVVGFNFPCDLYLYADIVPCYKYYTHQEWWSKSDPTVMESFLEYINSGEATWLLTLPNEDNEDILEIISQKYVVVDEDKYFNMYRIKESR